MVVVTLVVESRTGVLKFPLGVRFGRVLKDVAVATTIVGKGLAAEGTIWWALRLSGWLVNGIVLLCARQWVTLRFCNDEPAGDCECAVYREGSREML